MSTHFTAHMLMTANGYAIQMKRADVQHAVYDFAQQFETMLTSCEAKATI